MQTDTNRKLYFPISFSNINYGFAAMTHGTITKLTGFTESDVTIYAYDTANNMGVATAVGSTHWIAVGY